MKRILLLVLLIPFLGKAQIITTVAGNGTGGGVRIYTGGIVGGFVGDGGPAIAAELDNPMAVAFDSHGNLYFSDLRNNVVRKVDTSGIITTFAGNGDSSGSNAVWNLYSGDGGPATAAQLSWPWGIAIDKYDNLYISDVGNKVIRKVNASGIISTCVGINLPPGKPVSFQQIDGGPATAFGLIGIFTLSVDISGNLYFIDDESFAWKVDTAGIIHHVAGTRTGFYEGEGGPANNAVLGFCDAIKADAAGNLFIGSRDGDGFRILKIDTSGIIHTIAGTGVSGDGGDGGPAKSAQFREAGDILIDKSGNLFISDAGRVRKIDTKGMVTTVAGNSSLGGGYGGDGGQATDAQIDGGRGLVFDKGGNLFIADQFNNRIRKVTNIGATNSSNILPNTLTNISHLVLNPNDGNFTLTGSLNSASDKTVFVNIIDRNGTSVYKTNVVAPKGKINTQITLNNNIPPGVYMLYLKSDDQKGVSRFVVEK